MMGSLEDVTPARNFFVRFVAQREMEVNDSEWFEVLKRHGMVPESPDSLASSRKSVADASTKLSERIPYGTPEEEDVAERDTIKRRRRIPIVEVLSPFSIYYCVWQYFMMIVDFTYTAFWVPYSVVFVLEDCHWNSPTAVVDFLAGWAFVLDVIVNLRVGYVIVHNFSRTVELDWRRAGLFYILRGTFFVDALATIPVYMQTVCLATYGNDPFSSYGQILMQIMRMLRLVRFLKTLRLLTSDALDVASVTVKRWMGGRMIVFQMINIVILYLLTAHMMACAWYFTAAIEDAQPSGAGWPPVDGKFQSCLDGTEDDAPVTWLTSAGILCANNGVKYMAAFYFSTMTITTVGYGDIAAHTTAEQAVASVMMFLGAVFFGYLVSTTTIFLEKVSQGKQELEAYHEKVEVVNSLLAARKVPKSLVKKVRRYYSNVWSKASKLQEEGQILQELPFPLRASLAEHITMPLVNDVTSLSRISQRHWNQISRRFRPEWYPPGAFIAHPDGHGCGQGLSQEMDSLWLLERGEVACVKKGEKNSILVGPEVFGTSLILQMLDPDFPLETSFNTYMSTTPVWLWRINKEYLGTYFADNPAALVSFCEGVLMDELQTKIQGIDSTRSDGLLEKLDRMKENLPPEEESSPYTVSTRAIKM